MSHKNLPYKNHPFWMLPSFFDDEDQFQGLFFDQAKGLSISEDDQHIFVEAALPGLKPDDIEITLDKGNLWIKGHKSEQTEDKEKKYHKKASSSFSYSVTLPSNADVNHDPEAIYEDGIMKITFIKKEPSQSRKIQVKRK